MVMCMGKGGVGKTTVAAAIAVALAERGHEVHLSTTDPAAHLTETLLAVWNTCTFRVSTLARPAGPTATG